MSSHAPSIQSSEVHIIAPPDKVYALISDITRTGEWSAECRRCVWVGPVTAPKIGARFRGYNKHGWLRWSRLNEITTADPGQEFAFKVLPDWFNKDSSIWRYRLEPDGSGTRVRESTEVLAWPTFPVTLFTSLARRDDDMTENIARSLERIKAIVERSLS